ncbi:hypothetical protein DFH08DRAFT_839712 [Mycena albidolilacea]|uniref:Transmembrane protein n=1 Tax=Mycena albidolilacea TaxID=1033008 RepID=A0AAD7F4K7_9AGAR|nr:hypothetical protein DFH08DRAFT_839712 [Mycena albidolilacea]
MVSSNRSLIFAVLFSYDRSTFACFIPPTTTIAGSFSTVYPTSNDPATSSSSGTSTSSSITTLLSSTPSLSSIPPPTQSHTSPPTSQFATIIDNPLILAGLILLIISLTILFGVLCRVRRTRRRWRNLVQRPLPPRPPPPDAYMLRSTRSLSINNVALSSLGAPTPPRVPSPVLSFSAQSLSSGSPSSDIGQVQRDVRGLSFQVGPGIAISRPASRSSLGTTKTRRTSSSKTRRTMSIQVGNGGHPRRYGVLYDSEVGRWRDLVGKVESRTSS